MSVARMSMTVTLWLRQHVIIPTEPSTVPVLLGSDWTQMEGLVTVRKPRSKLMNSTKTKTLYMYMAFVSNIFCPCRCIDNNFLKVRYFYWFTSFLSVFPPLDIDECAEHSSGCTQICNNVYGSYFCTCHEGFSLDNDQHGCSGWTLTRNIYITIISVSQLIQIFVFAYTMS